MGMRNWIFKKLFSLDLKQLKCLISTNKKVKEPSRFLNVYYDKEMILSENVEVGEYTYFTSGKVWGNSIIGRYCSIGPNVYIGAANHPTNYLSTSPFQYRDLYFDLPDMKRVAFHNEIPQTIIGNDVWIGANVVIKAGVTVGTGAIIGAGSVVTKDIPPYSITMGSPGEIKKYRFNTSTIKELLESEWWTLDAQNLSGISFDNISKALNTIRQLKK